MNLEIRQQDSRGEFTRIRTDAVIRDVNSAFSTDQPALNLCSQLARRRRDVIVDPPTPPFSLVRCTNRLFGH